MSPEVKNQSAPGGAKRSAAAKPAPRLLIVAAPSGAGKTTLCDMLLKEFPNEIALSISTTTRPRRPYETEGIHYHYVTVAEFEAMVAKGEFAEWAMVHGNRYGTTKDTIERYFRQGKHILFDIDVQGAKNLQRQYPDRATLIFINPPSREILRQRLIHRRGDSEEAIRLRLANALQEMDRAGEFDFQITNDELNDAFAQMKRIVKRECGL